MDTISTDLVYIYSIILEKPLGTVKTLSNDDYKIKMYMHDLDHTNNGVSNGIQTILGGVTGKEESIGLVKNTLDSEGYPVTVQGRSLKDRFSSENKEDDLVDGLFLADRYGKDKTSYYNSYTKLEQHAEDQPADCREGRDDRLRKRGLQDDYDQVCL